MLLLSFDKEPQFNGLIKFCPGRCLELEKGTITTSVKFKAITTRGGDWEGRNLFSVKFLASFLVRFIVK